MKKLMMSGVIALVSLNAFAQESSPVNMPNKVQLNKSVRTSLKLTDSVTIHTSTMCIGGYLFAVATQDNNSSHGASSGISLVQIYKPSNDPAHPPQPISCK